MLGFVGCGNMAQAMLKGILSKGLYAKEDILEEMKKHFRTFKRNLV